MPLVSLQNLPARGPLLGLDPGARVIGVAGCDANRLIATGLEGVQRGARLAPVLDRIFALYDQRQSVGLVLGLPVNMDGTEGPRAQSSRSLARHLLARRDIPLALWDERLSTAGASRALAEAETSRARRDQVIDKLAAAWILQGAIDRLQHPP